MPQAVRLVLEHAVLQVVPGEEMAKSVRDERK
jgi:hypothetical protein